jgi:hypothetical protein
MQTSQQETIMATTPKADEVPKPTEQKLSGIGATEEQMDMKGTIPQHSDRKGTKIEDLAGNGEHDSQGG